MFIFVIWIFNILKIPVYKQRLECSEARQVHFHCAEGTAVLLSGKVKMDNLYNESKSLAYATKSSLWANK